MKIVLAYLACTIGCSFQSHSSGVDASDPPTVDAAEIDAPVPIDAPIDAIDAPEVGRTRTGLIGLWELDETRGELGDALADTSGQQPPVPLTVKFGTATLAGGMMTPDSMNVITSASKPRLNQEAMVARAVSLEAWVKPSLADQGTEAAPVVVAGLSGNINSRNVSLMQAGTKWIARVRTTPDANGKPALTFAFDVAADAMTHLVVVADATQRLLYVNGVPTMPDPAPGPPLNWDQSYVMTLGNESSGNRQWAGTFALVAIYARALTSEQIMRHYIAGPDAK